MSNIEYPMSGKGSDIRKSRSQRRIFGEVGITVLRDTAVFHQIVEGLWEVIDYRWQTFHPQVETPVSKEDYLRYAYTAVFTRVKRVNPRTLTPTVNGERFDLRCDDTWAISTPIATAINAIGKVELEAPEMVLLPVWNPEHDEMLLSRRDWLRVSQRLRMMGNDPECKFVFAKSLATDLSGDPVLMNLVPVRDELGRVLEITSRNEFDPVAGFIYLFMGLEPNIVDVPLPTHPMLTPYPYIEAAALMHFADRFIALGVQDERRAS